jgi:hypothetical protein
MAGILEARAGVSCLIILPPTMRSAPVFARLLRQFGKRNLVEPLDAFGTIANLPSDAPEHVVFEAIVRRGPSSARAFWKFLRDLPSGVGASSPAVFLIGCDLLVVAPDDTLARWDGWLKTLYRMALESEPAKVGDGSSFKYRDSFLSLVYEEMDKFLTDRIRFWLKESGAQEDRDWIARVGERAVETL